MRGLSSFAVLLLAVLSVSESRAETLMGYWKLDGTANDTSGNGNNGVIYGNPTWLEGGGAHFDGSTYIEIPYTSAWNFPGGFTIDVSFKCGDQSYPGGVIVSKAQSGVMAGYGIEITSPDNSVGTRNIGLIAETGEAFTGGHERIYGGDFTDGNWHEARGVYDGTALSLYVDGSLVAHKDQWLYNSFSPENIRIGGVVPGQYHTMFVGDIANVKIYDGATPEPSTFALLGIGAVSLLGGAWRRRQSA
jgi:hypothetical protein